MKRFQIIDAEQRSEEWFTARLGRVTGSVADCVTAKPKTGNGEAITRADLRIQLATEVITGRPENDDDYLSRDMKRGILLEPDALIAYEAFTGETARKTGFLSMSTHMVGCSLDADVDEFRGIVEAKCPKSRIHLGYIKAKRVPPEYVKQITHNLWVTGAKWVDFVSYNNMVPEHLQVFVVRAYPNEFEIAAYEKELLKFLAEVNLTVKELTDMRVAA